MMGGSPHDHHDQGGSPTTDPMMGGSPHDQGGSPTTDPMMGGSGRDENGNTASDHAEMQAMLPFIHQCQAKLADGDVCKTLDPESCAADPPPAHCEECKNKLMGCVKSLMGGANGGGSATTDPNMGGSPHDHHDQGGSPTTDPMIGGSPHDQGGSPTVDPMMGGSPHEDDSGSPH